MAPWAPQSFNAPSPSSAAHVGSARRMVTRILESHRLASQCSMRAKNPKLWVPESGGVDIARDGANQCFISLHFNFESISSGVTSERGPKRDQSCGWLCENWEYMFS